MRYLLWISLTACAAALAQGPAERLEDKCWELDRLGVAVLVGLTDDAESAAAIEQRLDQLLARPPKPMDGRPYSADGWPRADDGAVHRGLGMGLRDRFFAALTDEQRAAMAAGQWLLLPRLPAAVANLARAEGLGGVLVPSQQGPLTDELRAEMEAVRPMTDEEWQRYVLQHRRRDGSYVGCFDAEWQPAVLPGIEFMILASSENAGARFDIIDVVLPEPRWAFINAWQAPAGRAALEAGYFLRLVSDPRLDARFDERPPVAPRLTVEESGPMTLAELVGRLGYPRLQVAEAVADDLVFVPEGEWLSGLVGDLAARAAGLMWCQSDDDDRLTLDRYPAIVFEPWTEPTPLLEMWPEMLERSLPADLPFDPLLFIADNPRQFYTVGYNDLTPAEQAWVTEAAWPTSRTADGRVFHQGARPDLVGARLEFRGHLTWSAAAFSPVGEHEGQELWARGMVQPIPNAQDRALLALLRDLL